MLFQEILDEKYAKLWLQFEKLYELTIANQPHEGDLLLVYLNAFYNPEVHKWDNIPGKQSPYMFGPNTEGHSEHTHYEFIAHYVNKSVSLKPFDEYMKDLVYSDERRKEIDIINFNESISVQTEMLIYLKIWESDIFIKKFYQLANLLNGTPYDWHFKLSTSGRTPKAVEVADSVVIKTIGTRDTIIRTKIRDSFKKSIPTLYDAFKKSYNSQIRNSIAHSQYSIIGRHIQLNNEVAGDPYSQMRVVSFEDWTDRFHETIMLYKIYHEFLNIVNDNYGKIALENNNSFPIRIYRKDPIEEIQFILVYYRDVFKDWG